MTFTQSGLLLIDKPAGPSSAHVVHRVKKILGAKRVLGKGKLPHVLIEGLAIVPVPAAPTRPPRTRVKSAARLRKVV